MENRNLNFVEGPSVPAMSDQALAKVRQVEATAMTVPQIKIDTHHILHAGMYTRTIRIPAGVMITGALIKIPTILVVEGDVVMYVGDSTRRLSGYSVLSAEAGRKQAFVAVKDSHLTMAFATEAEDIETAENEFTDETDLLVSRRFDEVVVKEYLCQA